MATLAEILDEMADQVRAVVDDVTDVSVQVEPRMVLAPSGACVDMYPADPSDDPQLAAFGDITGAERITVRARVQTPDADAGQDLLLALMDGDDPLSIAAALTSDRSLNGLASSLAVLSRSGYTLFPDLGGDGASLGCLWSVEVVKAVS